MNTWILRGAQSDRPFSTGSKQSRLQTTMLSLAALRYRNVLAAQGGPVEQIETGTFPVCGRRMIQANARLTAGLTRKRPLSIYSDADGTGTHAVAAVARHMAGSEALERWA